MSIIIINIRTEVKVMSKTGRPAKENARKTQVTVRFTDEEYARLVDYATKSGKALTQVLREGAELLYKEKTAT